MSFFQQIRNKLNSLHELIFLNDNPEYCYEKFSDKKQIKILSDNVFPKIKKNPGVVKDNMFYASPWMMKISDIDTNLLVKKPDIFLFSTFFDYNKQYEKVFFTYYQAFVSFIKKFPEYIPLYKDNLLIEKAVIQIIVDSDMQSGTKKHILTHYLNTRLNIDVDIHYQNETYYCKSKYQADYIYDDIAFLSQLKGISEKTDKLLWSFLLKLTDIFHYQNSDIIDKSIQTNLIYQPVILSCFIQHFLSSYEGRKRDNFLENLFPLFITDLMQKYAIKNLDSQIITQYFLTVNNIFTTHKFFNKDDKQDLYYIKTFFSKSKTFYIPEHNRVQAQLFFISLFKLYSTHLYHDIFLFLNQTYTHSLKDIDFSVFLAFSDFPENKGIMCRLHERLNTEYKILQLTQSYKNIYDFFYHFQKIFIDRFFYSFDNFIKYELRYQPDNLLLFYNDIINMEIRKIDSVCNYIHQVINEDNKTTCFLFLTDMFMFYTHNSYKELHGELTNYCFQKIRNKLIECIISFIKNFNYEIPSTSVLSFTSQLTQKDFDYLFALLNIDYLEGQYFNHESLVPYIRKGQLIDLIETPERKEQRSERL